MLKVVIFNNTQTKRVEYDDVYNVEIICKKVRISGYSNQHTIYIEDENVNNISRIIIDNKGEKLDDFYREPEVCDR